MSVGLRPERPGEYLGFSLSFSLYHSSHRGNIDPSWPDCWRVINIGGEFEGRQEISIG